MRYCTRCLYPANHPLGITFDDQGICSGCRVHEEKDSIDWSTRFEKLRKICDNYRNENRMIHDCIVPVSGGRDSYFIVHLVKNILGMNPLLVSYNKHYNTRMGIRNLSYLRSLFGCDFAQCTVSPEKVKKITRETLKYLGSIYWHCLAGQTVFPVQTAVKFKIPLIIWGVHQGLDQVGMFSHLDEVEMTRKYRKDHDLMGLEAQDLLRLSPGLTINDMEQFIYPHDKEIEAVGVRGIYLNNYVRWDSKKQHEAMINDYGYETMAQQRTYDTCNDVDCFHYSGIHDYIKYLKWGYGKVTDHASREIRLGHLSREQGVSFVERYQQVKPRDLKMFLEWLCMPEKLFWQMFENKRDTAIWKRMSNGVWELIDSVVHQRNAEHGWGCCNEKKLLEPVFKLKHGRDPNPVENEYVLIGRGWIDKCQYE